MAPTVRRALVLALVLVAPVALAGCNLKDWYNQQGTVRVNLMPLGAANTSLTDFKSLKVAIYGVTVKQFLIIDSKEFSFGNQPLVVDFVEKGTKGEKVPLAETKISIRAVESITLRIDILEAIDAQGKSLPVCREGDATTTFPCFFVPDGGVYRHQDKPFSTPRGGSVTFNYPLGVGIITQGRNTEYFLYEDPNLAEIETSR